MLKVIECPTMLREDDTQNFTLFLAGGITGCPDWQKEMIQRFKNEDITLINPRRASFDITDPTMSAQQIDWENEHLILADAILFWFPFETLCPITLFELAKYAQRGKKIFVACHPAYARAFDVKHQLSLMRPDVTVHSSWEPMIAEAIAWGRTITLDYELLMKTIDQPAPLIQPAE